MVDLIVSQHDSFAQWARRRGLASVDTPQRRTVTPEDLYGRHVLTTAMPLHLAACATVVHEVTLELTPEMRGTVLTIDQLDDRFRRVSEYCVVRRVLRVEPTLDQWVPAMKGVEVVVTRHMGFAHLLHCWGVSPQARLVAHAQADDVRGRIVAGVLPLWLASEAAEVVTVDLNVPESMRGEELSAQQMIEYMIGVSSYCVSRTDRPALKLRGAAS